ncbi:antitoxin [Streptomyces buecherae]|uniref:antitoxin n=1 Tax=Streptomyces buecherae TaxID=2763006 RepID=UPI0037A1C269
MFDSLKSLRGKTEAHGEKISDGLERVGDFIDDKTDGKYSEKIDLGVDKVQNYFEGLGDSKG